MEQVVTLTSVEIKKEGESKHGKWVLRIFKDAGGNKYQTFDVDLGEKASGLIGRSVEVRFEVEQNGDYENNVLKAVREAGDQQTIGSPPADSQALTAPPVASQAPSDDREGRIMRQSALARACETVNAGIATCTDVNQLFAIADYYVRYFEGGSAALAQSAAPPAAQPGATPQF